MASDSGPMEECNKDALASLEGELKLNVIMNTGLINKLQKAAGGFMDRAEAQAVESKPNNAEQMGELIRILLGKRNADFKIFCTMLQKSNYGLWADELEKKAREFRGRPDGPPLQPGPPPQPGPHCSVSDPKEHTSPFSASEFLKAYEDEFAEVVNAKQSLLKLKHKGVISDKVRTAIEGGDDEDAKYTLLEHLQKNATVATLRVYCDVAMAANGYPKMQALGKKMKEALPPEGN